MMPKDIADNIIYKIPFKGDYNLLHLIPSRRLAGWSNKVYVEQNYICFEILDFPMSSILPPIV